MCHLERSITHIINRYITNVLFTLLTFTLLLNWGCRLTLSIVITVVKRWSACVGSIGANPFTTLCGSMIMAKARRAISEAGRAKVGGEFLGGDIPLPTS